MKPASVHARAQILHALPQDLWSLQAQSGYLDWIPVSVFSRSLGQYRQLRFHRESNVAISETGPEAGQVDVVEAILVFSDPGREAEFALYHPVTGVRLDRYPESVAFDIQGIHEGSKTQVPTVCTACHFPQKPLNAILAWSSQLEESIAVARRRGFGLRQDLVDPTPVNEETLNAIKQINDQMREQFPERFMDLRDWLRELPDSAH
jgi:hypothetical protein